MLTIAVIWINRMTDKTFLFTAITTFGSNNGVTIDSYGGFSDGKGVISGNGYHKIFCFGIWIKTIEVDYSDNRCNYFDCDKFYQKHTQLAAKAAKTYQPETIE